MKQLVFFVCLLVSTWAAPAPASESTEIAAHANEALRWMEMYRLYQQQRIVRNPFLPSSRASAGPVGAAVADVVLPPPADVPPPAPIPVGDASEEETEDGDPATKTGSPAPLNSDEVEEAEEVEAAETDPAAVEAAEPSANPAAAAERAVADVPIDAAPVDAAAVGVAPADAAPADAAAVGVALADVVPVDAAAVGVAPTDVVDSALAAPGGAIDPAAPATADILTAGDAPAEIDAGATDVGAAAPAA